MDFTRIRVLTLLLFACPASSLSAAPAISAHFSLESRYLDRGLELADTLVQPSIDIFEKGFYAGAIGYYELDGDFDETNLYAGTYQSLNPLLSLDGGFNGIWREGTEDLETYLGLILEYDLRPALYAYYETDAKILTLEFSVEKAIPLQRYLRLDWSITAGSSWLDYGQEPSYQYLEGFTDLVFPLDPQTDLRLGLRGAIRSEDLGSSQKSFLGARVSIGRNF
jgi:hypothetical protein